MSLGLFDVVGPIMHGPSSNHTGGANRIGYLAGCLIGRNAKEYRFLFHPILMRMYTGHRTHVALLAGCLGIHEYEEESTESMEKARQLGIKFHCEAISGEQVDRNTMRVVSDCDGVHWEINGISVGGGSIVISGVNGVSTNIDGNTYLTLYLLKPGTATDEQVGKAESLVDAVNCYKGNTAGGMLFCLETRKKIDERLSARIDSVFGGSVLLKREADPVVRFADSGNPPTFETFEQLLSLCKTRPMIDVVKEYETVRSGRTQEEVMDQALEIVHVIRESMETGRKGNNPLLCGFCSGSDGKLLDDWAKGGKSITGGVFNDALSGALSMAEISASAGRVVAVPTSGSAGCLPGTLFAVAKRFGSSDEQLAEAFLISAAVGTVIGKKCSFSGSIGGCQAEIGIGSGMAAAGACYLAGADAETAVNAMCFAIKNTLGLVCDPIASPVEVPCIKRNAMGAAVALMGAEMALAGVRSVVPPDDVVIALQDTEKRLPTALRGSCVGGLAATPIAKKFQKQWQDKLDAMN